MSYILCNAYLRISHNMLNCEPILSHPKIHVLHNCFPILKTSDKEEIIRRNYTSNTLNVYSTLSNKNDGELHQKGRSK